MGKAICKCGQQIRTNAKPGTQFQCPRCENILTVSEKILDAEDRIHAPLVEPLELPTVSRPTRPSERTRQPESESPQVRQTAQQWPNSLGLLFGFLFLATSLGCIAWVVFWPSKTPVRNAKSSKSNNDSKLPDQGATWSSVRKWSKDYTTYQGGSQIQALTEGINTTGQALDSRNFWNQLDQKSFQKRMLSPGGSLRALQDRVAVEKVIDKLGNFPIESITVPARTFTSDWEIIGMAQKGNELGVLVRYFQEPFDLSALVYSDSWIKSLEKSISFDEYFVVAKDLFAVRNRDSDSTQKNSQQIEDEISVKQGIFTPLFGYMVLILDPSEEKVAWADVVSLPGEVKLSRASGVLYEEDWVAFKNRVDVKERSVPEGWSPEGTIDVFGEYQSTSDESLAKDLVFSENTPDSSTALRLEQTLSSISPERTKQLIAVAQAVVSNYGELPKRVEEFRKSYPEDLGCDALMISLWLRFHDGKRSSMAFADFGGLFVDAVDRLYAKTKDSLLMELKSRVYKSNGQNQESDKQLELAEQAGKKSAFLFMRRIEQGVEENDKNKILRYLSQFSSYWIEQPGVTLQADPKSLSRKIMRKWTQESQDPKKD